MKQKRQTPFSAKSAKRYPNRTSKPINQPPVKPKNAQQRTREYLSDQEVNQLWLQLHLWTRPPLQQLNRIKIERLLQSSIRPVMSFCLALALMVIRAFSPDHKLGFKKAHVIARF